MEFFTEVWAAPIGAMELPDGIMLPLPCSSCSWPANLLRSFFAKKRSFDTIENIETKHAREKKIMYLFRRTLDSRCQKRRTHAHMSVQASYGRTRLATQGLLR